MLVSAKTPSSLATYFSGLFEGSLKMLQFQLVLLLGRRRWGGDEKDSCGQRRRGTTNNLREPCHLPREN